jgi:WhiB family redox-sensing transcriptional regulator
MSNPQPLIPVEDVPLTKPRRDVGPERWLLQALCLGVDPDLFFPERGASTREAKTVCAACPVRPECLDYAIENGEKFGIWGGLSERERRKVKRERSARRQASQ